MLCVSSAKAGPVIDLGGDLEGFKNMESRHSTKRARPMHKIASIPRVTPPIKGPRHKISNLPINERAALPVKDACAYTGLGRSTINYLISSNRIESVKVGRARRVLRQSLDDLLRGKGASG